MAQTPPPMPLRPDHAAKLFSRSGVRELDNGSLLVEGVLLTPEDAVRMLIRAMGCDPKEARYWDVPARVVRSLRRVKRGAPVDPEEAIRGQILRILEDAP